MGCCGQSDTPDVEWTVTLTDGTTQDHPSESAARIAATKLTGTGQGGYKKIGPKK